MKLSIIIATYNSESDICHALDSVKNQIFEDWECVVIDGGSKDNTVEYVRKYASSDSRFKYISEPDEGIYNAFNKGLKMSRGEWIYYLGSDDELTKNGINDILIHSEKGDVLYGNVIRRNNDKTTYVKSISDPKILRYYMPCSHQAMVMKRQLAVDLGGFDEFNYKISADFDLMQRAFLNGAIFYHADIPIAFFNTTGVSAKLLPIEGFKIRLRNKSCGILYNCRIFVCIVMHNIKTKLLMK